MNTLITGAAGFIGSHTVDTFLRHEHAVIGVDDLSAGRMENLADALKSPKFKFVKGDVTNQAFMTNLISDNHVRRIIHLSGLVSVTQSIRDPEANFHLNVSATDCLARAAVAGACTRFVFASSAAVYGIPVDLPLTEKHSPCAPVSPYGAAKLAAEKILEGYSRSYGMDCVLLRYFNVYGPRQNPSSDYSGVMTRFYAQLSNNETLTIHGDGKQTRDFIYVGDVAQVNLNATLATGSSTTGVFNVSTGIQTSINALAGLLSDHLARKATVKHAAARAGDITHSCGNSDRLRAASLTPSFTPLRAGMQKLFLS